MKLMKRLIAVGITALMLISQFAMTAFADTPATKDWMDPLDNAAFPKAAKVNVKYPSYYETKPAKDKVFSLNGDPKSLAAVKNNKTVRLFNQVLGGFNRTGTLLKDYVAVTMELIYHFENGFQEFEFMGVCGQPGIWAGMFGKENTIEFAYAEKETGPWTTYKYKEIRDITSAESTRAYFSSDAVPTSARYLKITFLECNDENYPNKDSDKPLISNWQCGLGYLYVKEYTTAQSGNTTTTSKPTVNVSSKSSVSSTSGKPNTGITSNAAESVISQAASTASTNDTSLSTESISDTDTTSGSADMENTSTVSQSKQTQTVVMINWPVVIAAIIGGVVVIGAGITVLILYLKKKKQ